MPRLLVQSCLIAILLGVLPSGCSRVDADQVAREAAAAMSAGDYAKGAKLAGKAMRAAPEKPEYAVLYGFALFENDEHLEARDQLAKTAADAPASFAAQYFYGWALYRLGAYGDAIVPLKNALYLKNGQEEHVPDILVLLSRCCLKQNLAAGRLYLKGLRRYRSFGDRPEVYNCLGLLQVGQGEHELALQSFEEALRLDPDNPVVLQNLAVLHDTYLGDPNRAIDYYRESFFRRTDRKDPTNQAAIRDRLRQLARGRRVRI